MPQITFSRMESEELNEIEGTRDMVLEQGFQNVGHMSWGKACIARAKAWIEPSNISSATPSPPGDHQQHSPAGCAF